MGHKHSVMVCFRSLRNAIFNNKREQPQRVCDVVKEPFVQLEGVRVGEALTDVYELREKIGSGVAGEVWRAVHRETSQEVAIKLITKATDNLDHPTTDHDIDKELRAMQRAANAHCVKLIEVFETADEVQVVLELMQGGDLFSRILAKRRAGEAICEEEVKAMMRQTIAGVKALHDNGVIHRDLKPENILLSGAQAGDLSFKIGDFGLAKVFEAQATPESATGRETPARLERTSSQVGTPGYAAPELLQGTAYSYEVDVWSLGVIAYCALSGCSPFPTDMKPNSVKKVLSGSYSFPARFGWDQRSVASQDFVKAMLQVDPEKRPSLDDLLAHTWLQMGDTAIELEQHLVETSTSRLCSDSQCQ